MPWGPSDVHAAVVASALPINRSETARTVLVRRDHAIRVGIAHRKTRATPVVVAPPVVGTTPAPVTAPVAAPANAPVMVPQAGAAPVAANDTKAA